MKIFPCDLLAFSLPAYLPASILLAAAWRQCAPCSRELRFSSCHKATPWSRGRQGCSRWCKPVGQVLTQAHWDWADRHICTFVFTIFSLGFIAKFFFLLIHFFLHSFLAIFLTWLCANKDGVHGAYFSSNGWWSSSRWSPPRSRGRPRRDGRGESKLYRIEKHTVIRRRGIDTNKKILQFSSVF